MEMEALVQWLRNHEWKKVSFSAKEFFQNATGCSSEMFDASTFLLELANALDDDPDIDELFDCTLTCYEFILKHGEHRNRCKGHIDRSIYFLLEHLITKTMDINRGIQLSALFRSDLQSRFGRLSEQDKEIRDLQIYTGNCYLIIWNQALTLERDTNQGNRNELALAMRLEALRFWATDHYGCLTKFVGQARTAAEWVDTTTPTSSTSNHVQLFYEAVFQILLDRMRETKAWPKGISEPPFARQVLLLLLGWVSLLLRMALPLRVAEAIKIASDILLGPVLLYEAETADAIELCLSLLRLVEMWNVERPPRKRQSSEVGDLVNICRESLMSIDAESPLCSVVDNCFTLLQKQLTIQLTCGQERSTVRDYGIPVARMAMAQAGFRERRIESQIRADAAADVTKDMTGVFSAFNLSFLVQYWSVRHLTETGSSEESHVDAILAQFTDSVDQYLRFSSKYKPDVKSCIVYVVSSCQNTINVGFKCLYPKLKPVLVLVSEQVRRIVMAYDKACHLELRPKIVGFLETLARLFCETKRYVEALDWIAQFLAFENDFHDELFGRWMSVKRNVRLEKIALTSEITMIDLVPKFAVLTCKSSSLVDLAKKELQQYLKYPAFYKHECCTVLVRSLMIMHDPLDKANVWITLAKLQLMVKEDLSHSPKDCIKEAMDLLEIVQDSSLNRTKNRRRLIDLCVAEAHFVKCFLDFTARMEGAGAEQPSSTNDNLQSLNDLVDDLDACDVSIEYLHLTISVENGLMTGLVKALDLWTAVINDKPDSIPNLPGLLVDLKMTAEMFAVKRMVVNEIRSWRLFLSVALLVKNDAESALGTARLAGHLARLGWAKKAEEYLKWQPSQPVVVSGKTEADQAQIVLLLAKSELQLIQNEIGEGWQTLQMAFTQVELLANTYSCQVLKSEAMLLASKFSELPHSVLQRAPTMLSPIQWAMLSFAHYSKVLKWPCNQDKLISSQMRYRVLGGIFESSLRLGRLYYDIGAPREARCYLKDQLHWAKHMSLANRTAEMLLILARLDILSDNIFDCQTKISNIDFIMRWEGERRESERANSVSDDALSDGAGGAGASGDDFHIQQPSTLPCLLPTINGLSEDAMAMSPDLLSKKRSEPPFWVREHRECENCSKCGEAVFLQLCLELSLLQAECFVASDAIEDFVSSPVHLYRALKQARQVLLEKEANVARRILNLVDDVPLGLGCAAAGSKRPSKNARPFLETELTLCHGYNRVAQLYLEYDKPSLSSEVIGQSSDILGSMPWLGVGRIYGMKAFVMYLKCMVELRNASSTMQSASRLRQTIGAAWPNSQAGYSDNFDVDYITKKVASLEVKIPAINICATPLRSCSAVSRNKAPIKKRPFKSTFVVDHGTPPSQDSRAGVDQQYTGATATSAISVKPENESLPSEPIIYQPIVKVKIMGQSVSNPETKIVGNKSVDTSPPKSTTTSTRKPRAAKENVTLAPSLGTTTQRKRAIAKKIVVFVDAVESVEGTDDGSSPRKKRVLSHPQRTRVKEEHGAVTQPLSPSKRTNCAPKANPPPSGISSTRLPVTESPMIKFGLDPSVFETDDLSDGKPSPTKSNRRVTRASTRNKSSAVTDGKGKKACAKAPRASKTKTVTNLQPQFFPLAVPSLEVETVRVQSRQSLDEHSIAALDFSESLATATDGDEHAFFGAVDPKFRCHSRTAPESNLNVLSHTTLSSITDDDEDAESLENLDVALCLEPTFVESEEEGEVNVPVIIESLEDALELIEHHPSVPLYGALHCLLALCKGEQSDHLVHHLSETMAITLRHTAAHRYTTLQRKLTSVDDTKRVDNLANRYHVVAFQERFRPYLLQEKLPPGWTVCQITLATMFAFERPSGRFLPSEIIMTQLRRGRDPVSAKIVYSYPASLIEFVEKMESIFSANLSAKGETDSRKWWENRREIDSDIQKMVVDFEDKLLGHWSGFLLGEPADKCNRILLQTVVAKLKGKLTKRGFSGINERLLEVIVDSYEMLVASQRARAIASLCVLSLNDPQLEDLCREFKLETKTLASTKCDRHHVILVLDKDIQGLPWESLPVLRNKSVSRMPSMHFILAHLERFADVPSLQEKGHLEIDSSSVTFVLNPGLDLKKSEDRMKRYFDSLAWTGLTGIAPTVEEWSRSLTDHELFVYCGHGAGSKYMGGDAIQNVDCKATVLLFGCSSGALRQTGRYTEPYGTVHNYILAGSPCVLGNLWDVTDTEIDKFTEESIKLLLSNEKHTLGAALTLARAVCQLKYLTGSAPILYGFPVVSK